MYTGVKQVRINCGDQFIKDFRSHHSIVVYAKATGDFFPAKRIDVWRAAKRQRINYFLSKDIYANGREVIVIV